MSKRTEVLVFNNGGGYVDYFGNDKKPLVMPTINFTNDDNQGNHHRLKVHAAGDITNNDNTPLVVPGLFDFDPHVPNPLNNAKPGNAKPGMVINKHSKVANDHNTPLVAPGLFDFD